MDMRIGYHVEEKYFGTKIHQAASFAQHRATTWTRKVIVEMVDHTGNSTVVDIKVPQKQVA